MHTPLTKRNGALTKWRAALTQHSKRSARGAADLRKMKMEKHAAKRKLGSSLDARPAKLKTEKRASWLKTQYRIDMHATRSSRRSRQ
eukprot:6202227-Pleurochrysis_carterae.AAC.1